MSLLHALRVRAIRLIWFAQVLSSVGDQLYALAMAWTALQLGGAKAGWVLGAYGAAILVFGTLGGITADRWDRRRTMMWADLLRAACVLLLPWLAETHRLQLWHLAAVGAVVGALTALFDPALQASLPILTGTAAELQGATALMDSTKRIARIFGPGLTGALLVFLPLHHFFTVDAVSFVVSSLVVLRMWGKLGAPAPIGSADRVASSTELREAVRLVRERPALWQGLLGCFCGNFVWACCYLVGLPLVVESRLHAGPATFGTLVALFGAVSLLGCVLAAEIPARHRQRWYAAGLMVMSGGYLAMAGAQTLLGVGAGLLIASMGGPLQNLAALRALQDGLPHRHLGKAYGALMVSAAGANALGAAAAAAVFSTWPVGRSMGALCAVAFAAGAAWLVAVWHAAARSAAGPLPPGRQVAAESCEREGKLPFTLPG